MSIPFHECDHSRCPTPQPSTWRIEVYTRQTRGLRLLSLAPFNGFRVWYHFTREVAVIPIRRRQSGKVESLVNHSPYMKNEFIEKRL